SRLSSRKDFFANDDIQQLPRVLNRPYAGSSGPPFHNSRCKWTHYSRRLQVETGRPMLYRRQQASRLAPVAESEPPAVRFDPPCDAGLVRFATVARSRQSSVAWLALWMAGALASYIAFALAVRALAKSLSVFEMMSMRSASGLVFPLGLMALWP